MVSSYEQTSDAGGRPDGPRVRIEPVQWDGQGRVALVGEIDIANVADAEAALIADGRVRRAARARPRRADLLRLAGRRDVVPAGPPGTRPRWRRSPSPIRKASCPASSRSRASTKWSTSSSTSESADTWPRPEAGVRDPSTLGAVPGASGSSSAVPSFSWRAVRARRARRRSGRTSGCASRRGGVRARRARPPRPCRAVDGAWRSSRSVVMRTIESSSLALTGCPSDIAAPRPFLPSRPPIGRLRGSSL